MGTASGIWICFARNVEMALELGSPSIRVDSVAAPGSIDDREYQTAFNAWLRPGASAPALQRRTGSPDVEFEPGLSSISQ